MTGATEPCALTVIRARGRRLAKTIAPAGTRGYDGARIVDLITVPVHSLAHLGDRLRALSARPDCCILRGEPIGGERLHGVRRLSHDDPKTGDRATLREVSRRWVALDIDGVPLPHGIDPRDLSACAGVVLARLPAAFHGAAALVQATAGHGMKPGARLRLWCWLSRPTSGAELARWLRGSPVDASIFRTAQPIYTAAPVFAGGAADPLPERLVMMRGAATVAVPCAAALAPPPPAPARPLRLAMLGRGSAYALAALARAGAAIRGGDGGRHLIALREAMGLARLVRAGLITEGQVERVLHAGFDVPGRGTAPDEAAGIVAWAMRHARDGALPEGVAP